MINKVLCTMCGGHCCKTMPGPTSPEDWGAPDLEQMRQRIGDGLQSGRWIVADNRIHPGVLYVMPLKTSKGCVFLNSAGCLLSDSDRPEGCRAFIPSRKFPQGCGYDSTITNNGRQPGLAYFLDRWKSYQLVLNEVEQSSAAPIRKSKGIWGRETRW